MFRTRCSKWKRFTVKSWCICLEFHRAGFIGLWGSCWLIYGFNLAVIESGCNHASNKEGHN